MMMAQRDSLVGIYVVRGDYWIVTSDRGGYVRGECDATGKHIYGSRLRLQALVDAGEAMRIAAETQAPIAKPRAVSR